MAGVVRALNHEVSFNGTVLPNVLSYRWNLTYDQAVGTATITMPEVSSAGTYFDEVTIRVNGEDRWSGVLLQWDYSLYPRAVTMQCKGRLEFLNRYKLSEAISPEHKGLYLDEFVSGDTTDENIVQAILDFVGVDVNGGTIGGTGTLMGTIAPEEYMWTATESALSYIHKIDAVSVGYRTFESVGGQIYRTQISSRPTGSVDLVFTEGEDISEGSSNRTVQEAYNACRIGGYAVGDYADPRVWYQAESNPFQGPGNNNRVFSWDNSMIERRAEVSPGVGMSCERIADYWLGELNREIVRVTMTTPRDDVIGPGQIHLVQASGGRADRLGVGEVLWVQGISGQLDEGGAFSQSMTYIGGGTG